MHWFRRDLRLDDNTALDAALASGNPVVPVYILDDDDLVDASDSAFLLSALVDLDGRLRQKGSRLLVRGGDVARELNHVAEEVGCWSIYFNRDYTPHARKRDTRVTRGMQMTGVVTQAFADLLLVESHRVADEDGTPPATFAEFEPRWLAALEVDAEVSTPAQGQFMAANLLPESLADWPSHWETPGLARVAIATPASVGAALEGFVQDCLAAFNADNGASRGRAVATIELALRYGTLSPRQVARAVLRRAAGDPDARAGAERFLASLARRDLTHHQVHALSASPPPGWDRLT